MKKAILMSMFTIFCAVILALSVRGISGNPTVEVFSKLNWRDEGPLELSPERSKFALLYSIVEDNSFHFSLPLARFVVPDVGFLNGQYVSLFPPGVSFFAIPGYIIGKYFGASQVGVYASVSLFALINVFLLRSIAIKLGAHPLAATLGSLIFIFATPAFAYGVNLYQHHFTVFFLLASIYTLLKWNNLASLAVVWLFTTTSFIFDYPNALLVLPIAIFALGRIALFENGASGLSMKIKIAGLATFITIIFPIAFLFWYNQVAYGSPFRLSQTVPGVRVIDERGNPVKPDGQTPIEQREKNAVGFFKTRDLLNGATIHLSSPDRGIIYYTPVMLFGIIGFFLALKNKIKLMPVLVGIIGANLLLYSMWGDPWGGWAFGSRYLIPSYAILSIFIALLLTYWKKKIWFLIPFILVAFYSIAVNTLGAITTSAIPPQVEVLNLEKLSGVVQKYTYERNWDFLVAGKSKSFVYQTFLKDYLTPVHFYQILTVVIFVFVGSILVYYVYLTNKKGGSSDAKALAGKENV